jgi:hypothetical protein
MQPASQTISKSRLWTGRIISTILMLFDAIAKLLRLAPVCGVVFKNSKCPPPTLGQAEGGRYKQNVGADDFCM